MMKNLTIWVLGLWGGVVISIALTLGSPQTCGDLCWQALTVGTPRQEVQSYLTASGIPQPEQLPNHFEWSGDTQIIHLDMSESGLRRLDILWIDPPTQPHVGDVLLAMGSPNSIYVESSEIMECRKLVAKIAYFDNDQLTLFTVYRLNNDPAKFGIFRLNAGDHVVGMSRFENPARITLPMVGWRGFAGYPQHHRCYTD